MTVPVFTVPVLPPIEEVVMVITTEVVEQCDGVVISQIWYSSVYSHVGVFSEIVRSPVSSSSVESGSEFERSERVIALMRICPHE